MNLLTTFPDHEYLKDLTNRLREKFEAYNGTTEQLLVYAGGLLNWIGDFITDPNIQWTRESLDVDRLTLTGTGPDWNRILIDRCERSPKKFRELLRLDADIARMFRDVAVDDRPILVRADGERLKVLDGMHRVVAAIRDDQHTLPAFVARSDGGKPLPACEPHVIYDLLRAYERGFTTDRDGLIASLRYLRSCYVNVDSLLRERFSGSWVQHKELADIVRLALSE